MLNVRKDKDKMKAVVFVDVQNDFIIGSLGNEWAQNTTPEIVKFAEKCVQDSNCKLYATRDTHEKTVYGVGTCNGADMSTEPQAGYMLTLEGKNLPVEHCIEGTDGWMVDSRLMEVLDGHCTFVNKQTFGSIDLAEIIEEDTYKTWEKVPYEKNYDLDEIVLCGFCTSICVVSNALLLRAKFPNAKITVMKDLCADVTLEKHNAALAVMQSCQIDVK